VAVRAIRQGRLVAHLLNLRTIRGGSDATVSITSLGAQHSLVGRRFMASVAVLTSNAL